MQGYKIDRQQLSVSCFMATFLNQPVCTLQVVCEVYFIHCKS